MIATRVFWQLLIHGKVAFEDLTRATRNIDRAIKAADKTYRYYELIACGHMVADVTLHDS